MANVPDSKKVQTMINVAAKEMSQVRASVAAIGEVRVKFQTVNPNVTGTPLEGNVAALNNAFIALKVEVDKPIWSDLITAQVPSHEGKALD
jgi:hypothetical protein